MKKSKYNIVFQNIILNTKSLAKIKFDDIHLENFNHGKFELFSKEELKLLSNNGFLVKSNEEELNEIIDKLRKKEKNEMRLIIFPTMQCYFRCKYCYEEKDDINLDDKYYEKIIELIKNFSGTDVLISWFGGEPSLKSERIISFLEIIKDICDKKDIKLQSSMTTNFYLINLKMLERLVNTGVNYFQVTLDGTEETHNQYRPLVNGRGSFDKVYENLNQALHSKFDFKIVLRLNFDNNTDYTNFFKMMIPFSNDKRFSFELNPICNWDNQIRDYTCNEFEVNSREKEIRNIMSTFNIRYDIESIYSKYMPCYACMKNNYIIDSNGNVKKCTVHLNDKNNCLGELDKFEEIDDNSWTKYKYKECPECEVFPLCLGKMCKYKNIDSFEMCRKERVMMIENEI